jgi:uncharacterized protein YdiU (UPF0061 family)
MFHLGIPTTRALCITGSEDPVQRETIETSAMLIRLAPTHVRFGSFDLFNARKQYEHVRTLSDYVIENFYQHLVKLPEEDRYFEMFKTVAEKTADMIARWQAVGFAHGVMNTDNMSILGLTLDYGPFGFLDKYDPEFICNHSDSEGRYAFESQPDISRWNLERLSVALSSLPGMDRDREINITRMRQLILVDYKKIYDETFLNLMRNKLGLETKQDSDNDLIEKLLYALQASGGVDYTNFFRELSSFDSTSQFMEQIKPIILKNASERQIVLITAWLDRYTKRLEDENITSDTAKQEKTKRMKACNPKYIPRNHILQWAIEKAQKGDYSEIEKQLELFRRPFDEQDGMDEYTSEPPPSLKMCISCSS